MVSILLNLIVGHYIVLGKNLIAVQIVMYVCVAYIELAISFLILGNADIISVWQVFVTAIIVSLALYIVLKVKEKNMAQKQVEDDEHVTITKTEYERLKAEIARLKELLPEEQRGGGYVNTDDYK